MARFKNCKATPVLVDNMRKLFQQTEFEIPGGQEDRRKFVEFFKKYNPEAYREIMGLL